MAVACTCPWGFSVPARLIHLTHFFVRFLSCFTALGKL